VVITAGDDIDEFSCLSSVSQYLGKDSRCSEISLELLSPTTWLLSTSPLTIYHKVNGFSSQRNKALGITKLLHTDYTAVLVTTPFLLVDS